ncbi:MAG TPA: gas vesicle protein [Vicinamibacterales bacterium]|nr:gas vesicle protein [Vicinamibacterales bacterium]
MPTDSMQVGHARGTGLVDILDRVLDKGLVIAGDIKISIAEVELLTIRIRLMVCSIDKAEQIGLDWWRHDRHLSMGHDELAIENEQLKERIRRLERQVEAAPGTAQRAPRLRAKRLDRR